MNRLPFAATTPPHFATLVLLTALSVLSLNMYLPSLSHIAADLQADYAVVTLSIAGYLAITAILQVVLGPLSDRYGRRPVLLWSAAIFTLASLGCAMAGDIVTFLAFRTLQGAIIAGSALSRAVVRDIAPPRRAASLMGYMAMAMAIAPMLGPILGGMLDEMFGWRANFHLFWIMGLAVFALCWADLGETNAAASATFRQQFRAYPELLRSRRFWGYAVTIACSVGGFYAFLGGAPIVAQTTLGMTPSGIGLGLGSISLGFFVGSFLSGRFAARFTLTGMTLFGRLVAIVGLGVALISLVAGHVGFPTVFGGAIFVGLGNGLTLPSANVGAMSVRANLAGSASGLSGALMVGAGAAITMLTGWAVGDGGQPAVLIAMMLGATLLSLLATLYVMWIDHREGPISMT